MASLINLEHFFGKAYIPNVDNLQTNNPIGAEVTALIGEHEEKFLSALLGRTMYNYMVGTADIYNARLLNGVPYTNTINQSKFWRGFQPDTQANPNPTSGASYVSPIALYVKCQWLANRQQQLTTQGNVTPKTDNGLRGTNWYDYRACWNEMVSINRGFHEYMLSVKDTITEFADYEGYKICPIKDKRSQAYSLFQKKFFYKF